MAKDGMVEIIMLVVLLGGVFLLYGAFNNIGNANINAVQTDSTGNNVNVSDGSNGKASIGNGSVSVGGGKASAGRGGITATAGGRGATACAGGKCVSAHGEMIMGFSNVI